jgi:hypothetical protein
MATPFYTKITYVKEGGIDLPLISLPAGTVLFRGIKLPEKAKSREIFRDYLGDPQGDDFCLGSTHNVFFFPFPTVAFGVDHVGATYKAIEVVVLVHPVTLVATVSPSTMVRGKTKSFSGLAPFQRCATGKIPLAEPCHPLTAKELDALTYDNCLLPDYQVRSGTRGMMSIAKMDGLNPEKGTTAMVKYIRDLESRHPGAGSEALLWAYTDNAAAYQNKIPHIGFPEIALYPYLEHTGKPLIRKAATDAAAELLLQKEALTDNLLYLPLALITKDAIIDMVEGHFNYDRIGVSENAFSPQPEIESRVLEFVDRAQTVGLQLPYYGGGQMKFDPRTGFFVLSQIAPPMYPLMPLIAEQDKARVREYMTLFRTVNPDPQLVKYGADRGFPSRAFVFNRPPVAALEKVLPLPQAVKSLRVRGGGVRNQDLMRLASLSSSLWKAHL